MKLTRYDMGAKPEIDNPKRAPDSRWSEITRQAAEKVGGYQALARKLGVAKNAPQNWAAGRHAPAKKYREALEKISRDNCGAPLEMMI